MGRKNKLSIQEEEILAEEIRKHPCLYDKSCLHYKDANETKNAWGVIKDILGYEEEEATRHFENLKKRYSKKRSAWRKAQKSPVTRQVELQHFDDQMKQYEFVGWLNEHMSIRNPKVNKDGGNSCDQLHDDDIDNKSMYYYEPHNSQQENLDEESSHTPSSSQHPLKLALNVSSSCNSLKRKNVSHTTEININKKTMAVARPTVEEVEVSESVEGNQQTFVMTTEPDKTLDQDDLFGQMIGGELKVFPPNLKIHLKNELQNVLYKHQMVLLQQTTTPPVRSLESAAYLHKNT